MRKTIFVLVAAIVLVVAGVVLWRIFNPGPLAFAGGTSVPLADYHAANPTGTPADLNGADVVKRGDYLARAADCVVCHSSPGGPAICRRPGDSAAIRHALFDQYNAR